MRMWLLPAISAVSRIALRTFYRFEVRGSPVRSSGPVLLVANHPNSIIDPGAVAAAAGRPVRFLAKAPFFTRPVVGPLMRAIGAIPVYRRMDDPAQIDKNEEMFRAVREALAGDGSVVGIFPEGLTHNLPAMAPLRTGAARIALGTAGIHGGAFPVIPVGLFFHRKEAFRSRALAFVGEPVKWDDLQSRGESDSEAVRELTRRIDGGLRAVTVNLEAWEDAAAVEAAAAIYAAEFATRRDPAIHLKRLQNMGEGLRRLRQRDPERVGSLLRSVLHFRDLVNRLGVAPGELSLTPRAGMVIRWLLRRLLFLLAAAPVALLGRVLFYPAYLLTNIVALRAPFPLETSSSVKVLGGAIIYFVWIVVLSIAAVLLFGPWWGLAAFAILMLFAFLTVTLYERVRRDFDDARRFLKLRRRDSLRKRLLARRVELANELERIRAELELTRSEDVTRL